jgi:hypothetical protein
MTTLSHRIPALVVATLLGTSACSSDGESTATDADGGGAAAGSAANQEATGGGGTGGAPLSSSQVTSPDDCYCHGESIGGSDAVRCDFVTVQFSVPVPVEGLEVEVDTSLGDTFAKSSLDPWGPTDWDDPLSVDYSEDRTQALGVRIVKLTWDTYAPESVDVTLRQDGTTITQATIAPEYACVEATWDDWCWASTPESIAVELP